MASIKELKDEINVLTYDLIHECFTYKIYHPDKESKTNKVISDIIRLRNELIHKVNNPENKDDRKELRAYFNRIRADLGKLIKLVEDLSKDG